MVTYIIETFNAGEQFSYKEVEGPEDEYFHCLGNFAMMMTARQIDAAKLWIIDEDVKRLVVNYCRSGIVD